MEETPKVKTANLNETAQALIVGGFLPAAFSIDPYDGRPVWDFNGLCALLNQRPGQLVELLKANGPAYLPGAGIPSSWKALVEP